MNFVWQPEAPATLRYRREEMEMEVSENKININSIIANDLKKIIEQIEKTGQPILIFRDDEPIAKIGPHNKKDPLEMDPELAGAFFIGDPGAHS